MARTELKLFRIRRGLSQFEMSEKLGYSRNQYARVESGEQDVTLKFLSALCVAFEMTLEGAEELTKRDKEKEKGDHPTC